MITNHVENLIAVRERGGSGAEALDVLGSILGSALFSDHPKHSKALRWVVEKTVIGEADCIKEVTIGVEVWSASFDPKTDARVRVAFHRIRELLARYYETEGSSDRVRVCIPKGQYVPTIDRSETTKHAA